LQQELRLAQIHSGDLLYIFRLAFLREINHIEIMAHFCKTKVAAEGLTFFFYDGHLSLTSRFSNQLTALNNPNMDVPTNFVKKKIKKSCAALNPGTRGQQPPAQVNFEPGGGPEDSPPFAPEPPERATHSLNFLVVSEEPHFGQAGAAASDKRHNFSNVAPQFPQANS
jgi:hypothetical protein